MAVIQSSTKTEPTEKSALEKYEMLIKEKDASIRELEAGLEEARKTIEDQGAKIGIISEHNSMLLQMWKTSQDTIMRMRTIIGWQ